MQPWVIERKRENLNKFSLYSKRLKAEGGRQKAEG